MKTSLYQWIKNNSVMLLNTGSLIGTMVVTSGLGFAFWWLAARRFSPAAVGLASAATSAMMLLSTFCLLGLGTLLISELPRNKGHEGSLISAALLLVGGVSVVVGVVFAVLAPFLSKDLQPLGVSLQNILLFAAGVSLSAISVIVDQSVIGLLRGGLQFWRNTLFTVAKLLALFIAGVWLAQKTGISIYAAWALGNVISLVPLVVFALWKGGWSRKNYLPEWSLIRKFGSAAFQHHILNLILQAPSQMLPVVVTVMLSAEMNAWFYVSSMMANFVFALSLSLTTVLHATNAAQATALAQKSRLTIMLSAITSLIACCVLLFAAKPILSFFGPSYAANASWSLCILAMGSFPLIIKNHYIAMRRIKDQITNAMVPITFGSILELGAAALGAHLDGLVGLSLGWVLAMVVEAVFMVGLVFRTMMYVRPALDVFDVSEYLDMPTEQLQPVIDMPTDTIRSIVFLEAPTQQMVRINLSTETLRAIVEAPTQMLRRVRVGDGSTSNMRAIVDTPTQELKNLEYSEKPTERLPSVEKATTRQIEHTVISPTPVTDEPTVVVRRKKYRVVPIEKDKVE